jgi:hypothetical protein
MKYRLPIGSEIQRYNIVSNRWEPFVTTKDAYYSAEEFLLRGENHYYVNLPHPPKASTPYTKIQVRKLDLMFVFEG